MAVLDYAQCARADAQPAPLFQRCMRNAFVTGVVWCTATGAWGDATWPRGSQWGPEKLRSFAFVGVAALGSGAFFLIGGAWLIVSPWYRRSTLVKAALWWSAIMFVYFGWARH